jgi:hypothetical protein
MSTALSESATVDLMETTDIGGTNAQNQGSYLAMANYSRASFYAEIGTWDSGDDLDECRLEQASDSSGTGVKDLTTDASGGDYDTDAPVDADGDFVLIEVRAEQMDLGSTAFNHIRSYVAEAGNTGADNVTGHITRYNFAYPRKELQGAATAASKVYVTT